MCLSMCLKKQEFQADCVYKLGVYKKKVCSHQLAPYETHLVTAPAHPHATDAAVYSDCIRPCL